MKFLQASKRFSIKLRQGMENRTGAHDTGWGSRAEYRLFITMVDRSYEEGTGGGRPSICCNRPSIFLGPGIELGLGSNIVFWTVFYSFLFIILEAHVGKAEFPHFHTSSLSNPELR